MSAENKVVATLRDQLKNAHEVLEGTMEGVSSEQAPLEPAGHRQSAGGHLCPHLDH